MEVVFKGKAKEIASFMPAVQEQKEEGSAVHHDHPAERTETSYICDGTGRYTTSEYVRRNTDSGRIAHAGETAAIAMGDYSFVEGPSTATH